MRSLKLTHYPWLAVSLVVLSACGYIGAPGTAAPEPTAVGEPLPGSFHLTSDPPLAPYRLTIRIDDVGGPSGRNAQFEQGDEIVVDWSTLPLPEEKWIEVNGQDCAGTFEIHARLETDLLLSLTDGVCHVDDLGSHPEGGSHWQPGELTFSGSCAATRARSETQSFRRRSSSIAPSERAASIDRRCGV